MIKENARVKVLIIIERHTPVDVVTSVCPRKLNDGIGAPKKSNFFAKCGKSNFIYSNFLLIIS